MYAVYGAGTSIVLLPKLEGLVSVDIEAKTILIKKEMVAEKQELLTNWQKAKNHLSEIYGEALIEASCSQLEITEQGNKITFVGSDTFTEIIENKFGAVLNRLSKAHNLYFVFKGKSRAFAKPIISEIRSY